MKPGKVQRRTVFCGNFLMRWFCRANGMETVVKHIRLGNVREGLDGLNEYSPAGV
jgi:hypothetical protein